MCRRDVVRWLMVVGVLGWSLFLPHAAAARPSQGLGGFSCNLSRNPWFVETLAFDEVTIAPGVVVESINLNTSNALAQLSNTSPISLYLVELGAPIHNPAPLVLPKNAYVQSQIVSDTVWTQSPRENNAEWQKHAGWHQILIERSSINTVLPGYTDRQVFGDQRPLTVTVPLPQVLSLQVIYGTELISIPVTQTYTLNASYNPTLAQDEQAVCDRRSLWFDRGMIKPLLIVVAGAVITAIFVVVLVVGLVSWILSRNKA